MIDIKKAITKLHPKLGGTILIAIDGHGGSGKSTLSKHLAKILDAEIIEVDDFASYDNPVNWVERLILDVIKPIQGGATSLAFERSSWWENHHPEPIKGKPVKNIMILEGVRSLRNELREYTSYGIFVDTPHDTCLNRGLERDSGTGKPKEEILAVWNKWIEDENKYMESDNPKQFADVVIDGTKDLKEQIG